MVSILHDTFLNFFKKASIEHLMKTSDTKSTVDRDNLSSLGIKYPKLRDHPLDTGRIWLESKRIADETEGLWRIHNGLYDFSGFVEKHPGGRDWLKLTKGTDITEAFEAHHLSRIPETILPKYFIKEAKLPRNSPFTFKDDGFYRVLKRKIANKLDTLPKQPVDRSKYLTDLLFFSYLSTALLATYFRSFTIGAVSGVFLALAAIASHNFFHKRDNFRMYYFDFTLMQSSEWRISHVLSHHLYTNTINDLEISTLEPFLQHLPHKKNLFVRYISWVYLPVVYAFLYLGHFVKTIIYKYIIGEHLSWNLILPFTVPLAMCCFTKESLAFCTIMFAWIITTSSLYFGIVGLSAAHHHPQIFHDGDAIRTKDQMDWGIYQLDAVADRKDIIGSHFLVLTNFGDHALHHLFPTIDHGLLEHLYPVFIKTCEDFRLDWKLFSQIQMMLGEYRQLARTEPNRIHPGTKI